MTRRDITARDLIANTNWHPLRGLCQPPSPAFAEASLGKGRADTLNPHREGGA